MMACLNKLKADIKQLELTFPKTHDKFQVISATVDEISCRFIVNNGKKYEFHATIPVFINHFLKLILKLMID
jgi:ubiquitin-conjugating enzyme E2 Q